MWESLRRVQFTHLLNFVGKKEKQTNKHSEDELKQKETLLRCTDARTQGECRLRWAGAAVAETTSAWGFPEVNSALCSGMDQAGRGNISIKLKEETRRSESRWFHTKHNYATVNGRGTEGQAG